MHLDRIKNQINIIVVVINHLKILDLFDFRSLLLNQSTLILFKTSFEGSQKSKSKWTNQFFKLKSI